VPDVVATDPFQHRTSRSVRCPFASARAVARRGRMSSGPNITMTDRSKWRAAATRLTIDTPHTIIKFSKSKPALFWGRYRSFILIFFMLAPFFGAHSEPYKIESRLSYGVLGLNNALVAVQNIAGPADIVLENLSTVDDVFRSERMLRDRFMGKTPDDLTEYLVARGFRCGNLGTVGRAEVDMSCRRSRPGSWLPFAFAQTTTVMFRGRRDAIENIDLIAKLDGFP
jgi:hypothetical protein